MRLPSLLPHHQPAAPDSPPSFTKSAWKSEKEPNPPVRQETERQLRNSVTNVLHFLDERGVSTVNKELHKLFHRHQDYDAVLTRSTATQKNVFPESLALTRLLSEAWTLLWCYHHEQLREANQEYREQLDLDMLGSVPFENKKNILVLEQAIAKCQAMRKDLCNQQVDLVGMCPVWSKPRVHRHFSTEQCRNPPDAVLLRIIVALDLEQSTSAVASPEDHRDKVFKVQYYEGCGHYCATCLYCDYGVCPICCYNARVMVLTGSRK